MERNRQPMTTCILLAILTLLLQSCMLLNPVKRRPLIVTEYSKDFPTQNKSLLVRFRSALPAKPLDETVWDNMQGAIWDTDESGQIGFTQYYQFMPVILPAGATMATTVTRTRIVIPFGNAFVKKFRSAVNRSFSSSSICLDERCSKGNENAFDYSLSIGIDKFLVFEHPLNHINFLLKISSQLHARGRDNPVQKQSAYKLKEFKLGSIASTSYGFIAQMNEVLNRFTEEVAGDLISNVINVKSDDLVRDRTEEPKLLSDHIYKVDPRQMDRDVAGDDLEQDFIKKFRANSNYFYKFDPRHSVDYMVTIVRSNVFSSPTTDNLGEILLSFGLLGKDKSFDCRVFYSKLSAEQKKLIDSKMENHPFICRDPAYTSESALASFSQAIPPQINNSRAADGHWAWFGATGDTEPLKRLLDNYLYNPQTCANCIEWSYRSNAGQNPDVKNFLISYSRDKTDPEKEKLSLLLPKE